LIRLNAFFVWSVNFSEAEKDCVMWKRNWSETKQHFADWWGHEGLILSHSGSALADEPHEETPAPPEPASIRDRYTNAGPRAQRNHHDLARRSFPLDTLPISNTDIGPGSLALFLGSEPGFSRETVWFEPCIHDCDRPEDLPPFRFDESNPWWRTTEAILKAAAALAKDKYLVGCPDLVENIDILSALRNPQTLLMDMIERPDWIERKVAEINQVWFDAYQRIYDIIKLEDGSSAFGAFNIWGPGKTAKLQCDASAMFSPDMFERFVVPSLTGQCEWLDYSMYHLDGTHAMCHLDALLDIDALDAIEWTPESGIEGGGDPRWHELYGKILDAGKSVQAIGIGRDQLLPLLDAVGGKGMYIATAFPIAGERDGEQLASLVEPYR